MNINLTLIGQTVTFIVFIWFCKSYIWPPLVAAMRERQKAIADGLAASERAEKDLELAQARVADQLREAKEEAQQIIEQARSRATMMIEEAKNDARDEGERLLEAARAEIDQEVNRAKENLRQDVSRLALTGAERILKSSVDPAKHNDLLDQLVTEL